MESHHKLFVYGTLKQGGKWHHLLKGQAFLGNDSVLGEMYLDTEGFYPILYQGSSTVDGEVYDVDEHAFNAVRDLESNAGYDCLQVQTRLGQTAMVYCYTDSPDRDPATRITTFDAAANFKQWLDATPRDSDSFQEFLRLGGKEL